MRKDLSVHYSSKTCEHATPRPLKPFIDAMWGPNLDVCATPENAFCDRFFTKEDDGLVQPWDTHPDTVVWCNPPYGREMPRWIERCAYYSGLGITCLLLLPARTDTKIFHRVVRHGELHYFRGRLRFGDAPSVAPFPSLLCVLWGKVHG
ncbi:MAG: DNA N-6-adenine-methyltransferase [Pseudomonadota bacterium]